MGKNSDYNYNSYNYYEAPKKKYGLGHFLLDLFLFSITGGLWGIYLIARFLRK